MGSHSTCTIFLKFIGEPPSNSGPILTLQLTSHCTGVWLYIYDWSMLTGRAIHHVVKCSWLSFSLGKSKSCEDKSEENCRHFLCRTAFQWSKFKTKNLAIYLQTKCLRTVVIYIGTTYIFLLYWTRGYIVLQYLQRTMEIRISYWNINENVMRDVDGSMLNY